jgi:GntR family transcriptional regulator/MocR family aminotransferase
MALISRLNRLNKMLERITPPGTCRSRARSAGAGTPEGLAFGYGLIDESQIDGAIRWLAALL